MMAVFIMAQRQAIFVIGCAHSEVRLGKDGRWMEGTGWMDGQGGLGCMTAGSTRKNEIFLRELSPADGKRTSPSGIRKRPRICRLVSSDNISSPPLYCAAISPCREDEPNQRCLVDDAGNLDHKTSVDGADDGACCNSDVCPHRASSMVAAARPVNPLRNTRLMSLHLAALRLEADLLPMRLVVSRLMSHHTLNRKGLFNVPVDHVALKLPDYPRIIKSPMDLGTVRRRLHSMSYKCRAHVARDIRLTFRNAMAYNPPNNAVHLAAKALLEVFEEAYDALGMSLCSTSDDENEANNVMMLSAPTLSGKSSSSAPSVSADANATATTSTVATKPTLQHKPLPVISEAPQTAPTTTASVSVSASAPVSTTDSTANITGDAKKSQGRRRSSTMPLHFDGLSNLQRKRPRSMSANAAAAAQQHRHCCDNCEGRTCPICHQGCIGHEPALLICQGQACAGARLRKGSTYYITREGNQQFCQRCYSNLPPVLPRNPHEPFTYKQHLLKRKNEEEVTEAWINCSSCSVGMHQVCAMFNPAIHSIDDFSCPDCLSVRADYVRDDPHALALATAPSSSSDSENSDVERMDVDVEDMNETETHGKGARSTIIGSRLPSYTFMSGCDVPVPLAGLLQHATPSPNATSTHDLPGVERLPQCQISSFIEGKVRSVMREMPNASATVSVRVISDCDRSFAVPDVIRRHFAMARKQTEYAVVAESAAVHGDDPTPASGATIGAAAATRWITPPKRVNYNQKAIALFQKIDGHDVCVFCMYVQEYDGEDEYDGDVEADSISAPHAKRVYVAYLDSVEHFRPRSCRTAVYHEILVSYLATARERGFHKAQIWACPPSRGNSFVFWNHPSSQRTPNQERLTAWYHSALSRAVDCGIVTDVSSLYESDFQHCTSQSRSNGGKTICPPLLDGDYWVEEAVRVHGASLTRHLKSKTSRDVCVVWDIATTSFQDLDPCPAVQVAALIRDRIMTHPSSVAFRKPVNAAALKLETYHSIVTKPMDFGTMCSKCTIGEYATLQDVVDDMTLIVSNARRFNPAGHFVHTKAGEIQDIFFQELDALCRHWPTTGNSSGSDHDEDVGCSQQRREWQIQASMSMSLDNAITVVEAKASSASPAATSMTPDLSSSHADLTSGTATVQSNAATAAVTTTTPTIACAVIEDDGSVECAKSLGGSSLGTSSSCISSLQSKAPTSQPRQKEQQQQKDEMQSSSMSVISAGNASPPPSHNMTHKSKIETTLSLSAAATTMTTTNKPCGTSDKKPYVKADLLTGGVDAIHQRMCGEDTWLLAKKSLGQGKTAPSSKCGKSKTKKKKKSKPSTADGTDEDGSRRKQSWLGEEVAESVRRMRTSFFTCSLQLPPGTASVAEKSKHQQYREYVRPFVLSTSTRRSDAVNSAGRSLQQSRPQTRSRIVDARHALLEFSQFRHFEFDTLRRAKYSTKMLLYYLCNDDAPGVVPSCTTCQQVIQKVRWHRVKKHSERKRPSVAAKQFPFHKAAKAADVVPWKQEELCSQCHGGKKNHDEFIPIPVSIKP